MDQQTQTMTAWWQVANSQVFSKILAEWSSLLKDDTKKEQDYQLFLRDHAGFFFPITSAVSGEQLVLEKVALGADYITDFINVNSNRSFGFEYALIEIESPHDHLFKRDGTQTSAFNTALQQVRDWKRWMTANLDTAKRAFPSKQFVVTGVPSIKYMVIIGRRDRDELIVEKRNQILRDEAIEVRSFDYLTDVFLSKRHSSYTAISHDLFPVPTREQNNEFSNPFHTALPDAAWRKLVAGFSAPYSHMVARNLATILATRRYNEVRLKEFLNWIQLDGRNTPLPFEELFLD